jgi:hypothetical protein
MASGFVFQGVLGPLGPGFNPHQRGPMERLRRLPCRLLPAVLLVAAFSSGLPGPAFAQTAGSVAPITADFAITNGRFYTQANGGVKGAGFAFTNDGGIPMWDWFQRYGAVNLLGYPNTGRFMLDGFVVQGTQRVLLQWRPDTNTMAFVNIFDRMHQAGLDPVLQATYQIPPQIDNSAAEQGLSFDQIKAIRESWLNFPNPAFKDFYFADPYHIDHYGLPTSHIEDFGPFLTIRLQRVAFQLWKVDGPAGIKAGQLVLVLGSDIAKALHFYPNDPSTPAAAPISTPPPAPHASGLQYGFGAQIAGGQEGQAINATQQAGFGWLKQQVRWCDLQPNQGTPPNWGELDAVASDVAAAHLDLMFSVVCAPSWAAVANGEYPKDPALLATFLSQLTAHFKGRVEAYEVWNEENFAREVGPGNIDAGNFVNLMCAAYPAIKNADPSAIVVSGAPTPTGVNDPNIAQDDLTYLSNMYAVGNGAVKACFDVLGAHPEGYGNPPEQNVFNHTATSFANHPSFFFRRAEDYRNVMVAVGDGNKPIWATETGYDSNGQAPAGYEYARTITEAEQADWLVREFAYAKANWPWMGVMFVWNLNFQAVVPITDEKWGFSVLRNDYSPRPAYAALVDMAK